MKLKLLLLNLFLIVSFSFGQNSRLECTDAGKLNDKINELYDFFKHTLNDEIVSINQESYYFLIFGEGETDYSFYSLVVPTTNGTTIYQYSQIEYIVKETYDVNLKRKALLNYLYRISKKPEDYVPNLYYVIISTGPGKPDECESVIGSLTSLPSKEEYLIDYKNLLEQIKE